MTENRHFAVRARILAGLFALAGLIGLTGCGGGSGAPNNPFDTPGPLAVNPPTLTAYSVTPTTVSIAGGKPPYTIVSSDQTTLPVPFDVPGSSFTVVPNNVNAITAVTLTARDAFGDTAQSSVTVNPAPLINSLKLKPDAYIDTCPNPGGSANPTDDQTSSFVCSGQTASVAVRVANAVSGGLAGRLVRFDIVQGAFQINTELPGQMPTYALTYTVPTDQNGNAVVRIRVVPNAPTQTAIVQATDVSTGAFVRGTFVIVSVTNANAADLVVVPTTVDITGPDNQTCSSGVASTYYIFGGSPPYTVVASFPQAISISPSVVQTSGAGFTATTNGACVKPMTFAITDSAGHTVTVTLTNELGTNPPASTTTTVPIAVTPPSFPTGFNLPCGTSTTLIATGGGFITTTGNSKTYTPASAFVTSTNRPDILSVLPASAGPGAPITLMRIVPATPPQLTNPPAAEGDTAIAYNQVNPPANVIVPPATAPVPSGPTANVTVTLSDGTSLTTLTLSVDNQCKSAPSAPAPAAPKT